jgi:hypothetical protein
LKRCVHGLLRGIRRPVSAIDRRPVSEAEAPASRFWRFLHARHPEAAPGATW